MRITLKNRVAGEVRQAEVNRSDVDIGKEAKYRDGQRSQDKEYKGQI
jgi:hypothetical protein